MDVFNHKGKVKIILYEVIKYEYFIKPIIIKVDKFLI